MMTWIWPIIFGVIGVFVGGIINAAIIRINEGTLFSGKKSACKKCLVPAHISDTIPILSFLRLRGKCRHCSEVIEWQYPAIELMMGILFAAFYARAAFGIGYPIDVEASQWIVLFIRDAIIATFLVIIFVYDFKYEVILDRFTIPATIVALLFNIALGINGAVILLGGLLLGTFFGAQYIISHGHWVGGGDMRLGLLIGILLGPILGTITVFLAYILGAIIGIALLLLKKRNMHDHMPFGTFLAVATIIVMIFGNHMFEWYLGFFI